MTLSTPPKKYQYPIYAVTAFTFIFGVVTLGYGVHALNANDGSSVALPAWALQSAVAFGAIIAIVSLCGYHGAKTAPDHIENKTRNWFLVAFFVVLFVGLIIQLAIAGTVLAQMKVIQSAQANQYSNQAVVDLDNDMLTTINKNPTKWIDIQTYFNCCGFNSTSPSDPTATGPACTGATPATPTCRSLILNQAESSARTIGALAVVLAFAEAACLISSFCLLFCIKRPGDD